MRIIRESEEMMRPTVEWMREKYDQMNKELFGGRLPECNFAIFKSGAGSEGNTFGRFSLKGDKYGAVRVNNAPFDYRRMFVRPRSDIRKWITRDNFYKLCSPEISLNGNYVATEEMWLGVLVHEMCHLYTYMLGYAPKQGHGPEFREIGSKIAEISNGRFNITRFIDTRKLADQFKLDDAMVQKAANRKSNAAKSTTAILAKMNDGKGKLILVSTKKYTLAFEVVERWLEGNNLLGVAPARSVEYTRDENTIEKLLEKYQISRTFRYYTLNEEKTEHIADIFRNGSRHMIMSKYDIMENESAVEVMEDDELESDSLEIPPNIDLDEESPLEDVFLVRESRSSDELRKMIRDIVHRKHGKVRFKYRKLDGTIRRADAGYTEYRRRGGPPRPPDIITYYDTGKKNFRCFHDWQLITKPKWIQH